MRTPIIAIAALWLANLAATASAIDVPRYVDTRFEAKALGLTEDESALRVVLRPPEDRRVQDLRGGFIYYSPNGKRLLDRPTIFDFGESPFDHQPYEIRELKLERAPEKLRELALGKPDQIIVKFAPTKLVFDEKIPNHDPRIIKKKKTDDGVALLYEINGGEYVLWGDLNRRWHDAWIDPRGGLRYPEKLGGANLTLMVKIKPPSEQSDDEWSVMVGTQKRERGPLTDAPATQPADDAQPAKQLEVKVEGEITTVMSALAGFSPKAQPGEKNVPVRNIEVPRRLDDVELHIIPYRISKDGPDRLVLAMAEKRSKLEKVIKVQPGGFDFDWNEDFHVSVFANGKVSGNGDENGGQ